MDNNNKDLRHLWGLNPGLKEFFEKKPGLTLLGLWWAWYWRLMIVFLGAYLIFFMIILFLKLSS